MQIYSLPNNTCIIRFNRFKKNRTGKLNQHKAHKAGWSGQVLGSTDRLWLECLRQAAASETQYLHYSLQICITLWLSLASTNTCFSRQRFTMTYLNIRSHDNSSIKRFRFNSSLIYLFLSYSSYPPRAIGCV